MLRFTKKTIALILLVLSLFILLLFLYWSDSAPQTPTHPSDDYPSYTFEEVDSTNDKQLLVGNISDSPDTELPLGTLFYLETEEQSFESVATFDTPMSPYKANDEVFLFGPDNNHLLFYHPSEDTQHDDIQAGQFSVFQADDESWSSVFDSLYFLDYVDTDSGNIYERKTKEGYLQYPSSLRPYEQIAYELNDEGEMVQVSSETIDPRN